MGATDDFGVDLADKAIDLDDDEGFSFDDGGRERTISSRGSGGVVPKPAEQLPLISGRDGRTGGGRVTRATRIKRAGGIRETDSGSVDSGTRPELATSGTDDAGTVGGNEGPSTTNGHRASDDNGRTGLVVRANSRITKGYIPATDFTKVSFQCTIKDIKHTADGSMVIQFVIPYSDVDDAIPIIHAYHKMVICTVERKAVAEDA